MANKRISELTAASSLTGAEQVEIVQSGTNKRVTTQEIADLGSGVGAVKWGGLWAFPAGAFPTATSAGTLYVATADKGNIGDPDYVPSGAWFISNTDGANEYSEFSYLT